MPTSLHRALCVAALVAVPLAACGDDDDPAVNGGGGGEPTGDAIEVTGTAALRFEPSDATAPAGTINFVLINEGGVPHTLVVEGHEDEMKLTVGSTDEGSIDLEAGEYVFYCDVPGHRGNGMEGTLTVE